MSKLRGEYVRLNTGIMARYGLGLAVGLIYLAAPAASFALNKNCTLTVPSSPLSAAGLATPYLLSATNPLDGPCHEINADQAAFVEAAVINLITGQISIYHPLVIDAGTVP